MWPNSPTGGISPAARPNSMLNCWKSCGVTVHDVGRDYDEIVKTWAIECVAVADTHAAALEIAQTSPLYDPNTAIVGTPDEVEAQLRRFTDLGVEHFMFRFPDFPKTVMAEFFAKEVVPRFQIAKIES